MDHIHEDVVRCLAEFGVDLSQDFPKPLTDEVVDAADVVITMGRSLEAIRTIRIDIERRVQALLDELIADGP